MLRITVPFLFLLFCLVSICHSAELTADALIQGVNQSHLMIRSGEIHAHLVEMRGHVRSNAEIATWKNKRIEEWLKIFKMVSDNPQADAVKAFKENFLNPVVDFHAKASLLHPLRQRATICFQRPLPVPERATDFYQYKIALQKIDGLSLDSEGAPFGHDSDFYLLTYDAQKQVKQDIGNAVHSANSRDAIQLFHGDNHVGYWGPERCGRAPLKVPVDAKLEGIEYIDNVKCYILAYTTPDGTHVRNWVDIAKDFCIRRNRIRYPSGAPLKYSQADYKAFLRFGDIWYPTISQFSVSKKDSTLQMQRTIEVKAAGFNVDFPKDFFKIDRDFFGLSDHSAGMGFLPDSGILPAPAPTGTDVLLLLCGPQSLLRICELLKVTTNLSELKKLSGFDVNHGTTMLGLKKAAAYKGLTPSGVSASVTLLKRNNVPLPAIAYVDNNHFLVFETIDEAGVKISDPAQKYAPHLTWDKLSEIWRGELLIFDKKQARRAKQKQVQLAFTDTPEYDFGKALGGSKVKHTFTLKNIGQKPLNILSVTETCACTATVLSQDEIPAGGTASIAVVLTVPSENQWVQESLFVLTDDPIEDTLKLTLKGQAFIPLTTFPKQLAYGNQNPLQKPLLKRVSLHPQDDVQVLNVRTDSEHLTAALKKTNDIHHVNVQLLPSLPIGQFSHNLLIDYTYKEEQTTHNVLVFGEVLGELRVVPNRLFFGLIKEPSAVSKTITISARYAQPFKIIAAESPTKEVVFKITADKSELRSQVTISITPTVEQGEFSGDIVIHTSSSVQPTVRVPFFGIIADSN